MHGYKWPINCTRTRTGKQLLKDVDAALCAMFDPDAWHSKISFLEGARTNDVDIVCQMTVMHGLW